MNGSYADATKRFEGFAPRAQWDYKQNTNGYGTRASYPGEVIDRPTAEQRFSDEYAKAKSHVDSFAPNAPEGVKAALTDLTFNAGPGWANAGLGRAVQSGDWDSAKQHFLEYNKAGGSVNSALVSRRAQGAQWFDEGQGPGALSGATGMPTQSEVVPQQRYVQGVQPSPGALSQSSMMGPGALTDGNTANTIGTGMQQAAAWLGSISNPATLGALPSLGPKPGRYQTQYDAKTGRILTIDTQTGRAVANQDPNFDPHREAKEKYDEAQAKSFSDMNDSVYKGAMDSQQNAAHLKELRGLLQDPNVYQGSAGEYVSKAKNMANSLGMRTEGLTNTQLVESLSNQLSLQMRNLAGGMPGSLSDKDLSFLKGMSVSLSNGKEANTQIVDRMAKVFQRMQDINGLREGYVQKNGRLDEGFRTHVRDWANRPENALFNEQDAAPATAAASSAQSGFKVLKVH
jgi:lysozyme